MDEHDPTPADDADGADVLAFPTRPLDQPVDDHSVDDHPADERPLLRDVLGDILREERLDQQRTLADVAEEAAVSLPYLSEIERGRKEVSSDVLDAVIRSLGLDLADVVERAADRLRPGVEHLRGGLPLGRDRRGPQARLAA